MTEIDLNQITSKIKTKKECRNFCTLYGKFFPNEKVFNCEFFYQYCAGLKYLLDSKESGDVELVKYITIDNLQKKSLLSYCLSSEILSKYFPDGVKENTISRNFIIQVSIIN